MTQSDKVTIMIKGGIAYVVSKTNPNIQVVIMDYDIDQDDEQSSTDEYGNKCIISIE